MAQEIAFWEVVDEIREADGRYRREAYGFLMAALGITVHGLPEERKLDPARRHLSGGELLEGMVRLARNEFGELAPTVFSEWGVHHGEDVGEMVFQLVASGQLSARPEDTLEDFRGFRLMEALRGGGTLPAGSS
ncbi:MAG TPA: Minf_1886 family protein [Candidatus Sulfotelmatobacter sp.]|nr:Minf_1886 family protein [Candidatus Sulfotelmatobacter sp.]